VDLRALPFELFFPNVLVVRALSFVQLTLRPKTKHRDPKFTVCRQRGDSEILVRVAMRRSQACIQQFLQGCGAGEMILPSVSPPGQHFSIPFPLFSSKVQTSAYRGKYSFCEFFDLIPGKDLSVPTAIHMFTYSDLCEMSAMIHEMIITYPSSCFMFIPAAFVRDAFALLVPIMARHQQMVKWVQQNNTSSPDATLKLQRALLQVPYNFVTILQGTLMEILGCPIALICPLH
jgi:hypothetical protein